jgi:carnitine 3-dehydrogenase
VADPDVVIASSTSGLLPSRCARHAPPRADAGGHLFNPVYLLPLVELCAGERTSAQTVERAAAVYRALGMAPLIVQGDRRLHADRLMEALWRAPWLVNDELRRCPSDDAVRLGAGLRWAAMGSFQITALPAARTACTTSRPSSAGAAGLVVPTDAGADRRAARPDRRPPTSRPTNGRA